VVLAKLSPRTDVFLDETLVRGVWS
jgi:hypothetical protein